MKHTSSLILAVIIAAMALFGLYACGGESPTMTPTPPTTSPAPPTSTSESAANTGAGSGRPATADEVSAIRAASLAASDSSSYHFVATIQPSDIVTQPVNLEGDYVAPYIAYFKGAMGDQKIEQIVVNDHIFVKDAGGSWAEAPVTQTSSSDPTRAFRAATLATSSNPVLDITFLRAGVKTYTNEGTESMDGVTVTKFGFKLDMVQMMDELNIPGSAAASPVTLGGGNVWVDTSAKQLHKIDLQLDLGPLMGLLAQAQASSSSGGNITPGGSVSTPAPRMAVNVSLAISKQNDPSISIPLTDEMKQIAQATPAAIATFEAQSTPSSSGQVITGNIGERLMAGGVALTVNKVERTEQGNLPPGDGNEYVIVTVTVENEGPGELALSSLLSFALVDGAGTEEQFSAGVKYTAMFDAVTDGKPIAVGQKVTGEIGYEVEKGKKDLTLTLKPDLLSSDSSFAVAIDR